MFNGLRFNFIDCELLDYPPRHVKQLDCDHVLHGATVCLYSIIQYVVRVAAEFYIRWHCII
jgi:hypothetical protein